MLELTEIHVRGFSGGFAKSCLVFILLSIFITLALISELREFPTFDNNAKTMLLVVAVWLTLNFLLSVIMMKKWFKENLLLDC